MVVLYFPDLRLTLHFILRCYVLLQILESVTVTKVKKVYTSSGAVSGCTRGDAGGSVRDYGEKKL